jgi:hypothetical protein
MQVGVTKDQEDIPRENGTVDGGFLLNEIGHGINHVADLRALPLIGGVFLLFLIRTVTLHHVLEVETGMVGHLGGVEDGLELALVEDEP